MKHVDVDFCLLLVMVAALLQPARAHGTQLSNEQPVNKYRVTISLSDPPSADVEAVVNVKDGQLFMIGGSVNHLARGWATFVSGLAASDMKGTVLPVSEYSDESYKAQWKVGNGYSGLARVRYHIDLGFAKTKWEAGNEQAAFYDGKALFAATRTLFIVPDLTASVAIQIERPPNLRLATSWKDDGSGGFTSTAEGLVNNTLVIGDFSGLQTKQGNLRFTVALLGEARAAEGLVVNALKKYTRSFTKVFDQTPDSSYLMTLFYAESEDGESYANSAAFTTPPPMNEQNMIMWANTLGHELFHFWCGQQISGSVYEESQWFREGFTEYYANLAMMRERIMPEKTFIWKIERALGKYVYFRTAPQFEQVSIRKAGERKTTYRFGVYDGGWAIAFGLDMEIRDRTSGRKSLDDLMKALYAKYGLTNTKYKFDDIRVAASEVSGSDMSDFFKRYVDGTELLPVRELLLKVGYESASQWYANELLIIPRIATARKNEWLWTN